MHTAHGPLTFIACVELRGRSGAVEHFVIPITQPLKGPFGRSPRSSSANRAAYTHTNGVQKRSGSSAVRFEWVERIPLTSRQNRLVPRGSHALMQSPLDPETCYIRTFSDLAMKAYLSNDAMSVRRFMMLIRAKDTTTTATVAPLRSPHSAVPLRLAPFACNLAFVH